MESISNAAVGLHIFLLISFLFLLKKLSKIINLFGSVGMVVWYDGSFSFVLVNIMIQCKSNNKQRFDYQRPLANTIDKKLFDLCIFMTNKDR